MALHGSTDREVEYDFLLDAHADPRLIQLKIEGASAVVIEPNGALLIQSPEGPLRHRAPVAFQEVDGVRRFVPVAFQLLDARTVGFQLGDYDPEHPLVIDPVINYSTYHGGTDTDASEAIYAIATDAAGNLFAAGLTTSLAFPIANSFQATKKSFRDIFVTKFSPDGRTLLYSTYLGGSSMQSVRSIAVDSEGNAVVVGDTSSRDFPTFLPFQAQFAGGNFSEYTDAFLTKLNAAGSALVFSTYLGGSGNDQATGVALDSAGNIYVAGRTRSPNFPSATPLGGPFGGGTAAFLVKFSPSGGQLLYSRHLTGNAAPVDISFTSANSIAVDSSGSVYLAGDTDGLAFPVINGSQAMLRGSQDAFVAKVSPTGNQILYSTLLGGTGRDLASSIAVDFLGRAVVTGTTTSADFPLVSPLSNDSADSPIFVSRLSSSGGSLDFSTFLGKAVHGGSVSRVLALDGQGSIFLVNSQFDATSPTVNPLPGSIGSTIARFYIAKIASDASRIQFASYYGGSRSDIAYGIATGPAGSVFAAGGTTSLNFPLTNARQSSLVGLQDAFVLRLSGIEDQPFRLRVSQAGNFKDGQAGAQYMITVTNLSTTAIGQSVGISANFSFGQKFVFFSGAGWNCGGTNCSRADSVAPGTSYPPLFATVNIDSGGPTRITSRVNMTVSNRPAGFFNYSAAVSKDQVISFGQPSATVFGQVPFLLPATASSGLPLAVVAAGACTYANGLVSLTGTGTCTLTVSQGGDDIFQPAASRGRTFTVFPANTPVPALTLSTPTSAVVLGAAVTLTARFASTASGAVTFYDRHLVLGAAPLINGTATFTTWTLPGGAHQLCARNSGSGNTLSVTSNVTSVAVTPVALGVFQNRESYSPGVGPTSPVPTPGDPYLRDFNNDGKTDLLLVPPMSRRIALFPGDGGGRFGARVMSNLPFPKFAFRVSAVADFNVDGKLDVAVAGLAGDKYFMVVLGGVGDGTFVPLSSMLLPEEPVGLVAGDLNNDGVPDVAVNLRTKGLHVAFGSGEGALGRLLEIADTAGISRFVSLGDANGDGLADLFVEVSTDTRKISVFLNSGNGSFVRSGATNESNGFGITHLAVADFNSDGQLDLAASSRQMFTILNNVRLGGGNGTFSAPLAATVQPPQGLQSGLTALDADGDGRTDLLASMSDLGLLLRFRGRGDGTFDAPVSQLIHPPDERLFCFTSFDTADLNGDGRLDVVAYESQGVSWLSVKMRM